MGGLGDDGRQLGLVRLTGGVGAFSLEIVGHFFAGDGFTNLADRAAGESAFERLRAVCSNDGDQFALGQKLLDFFQEAVFGMATLQHATEIGHERPGKMFATPQAGFGDGADHNDIVGCGVAAAQAVRELRVGAEYADSSRCGGHGDS